MAKEERGIQVLVTPPHIQLVILIVQPFEHHVLLTVGLSNSGVNGRANAVIGRVQRCGSLLDRLVESFMKSSRLF
jgi:hypothetical protein